MKHIKLESIHSTQTYLKNLLLDSPNEEFLVTTLYQTEGHGRHERKWIHSDGGIACSFTYKPNLELPFASIETAIKIVLYFKNHYLLELGLKWPNDLFYKDLKCGGILAEVQNGRLIIGLGMNLTTSPSPNFSCLLPSKSLTENDRHRIPADICTFMNSLSFKKEEAISIWERHCIHLNKSIFINDRTQSREGIFRGLNSQGAAIVETNDTRCEIYSGEIHKHEREKN